MFLFLVLCYNTATGWQPICSWINIIIIIIIMNQQTISQILQKLDTETSHQMLLALKVFKNTESHKT